MTTEALLRAGLAVNLGVPLDEADRWARRLVEADARVTIPHLTPEERADALGMAVRRAVWPRWIAVEDAEDFPVLLDEPDVLGVVDRNGVRHSVDEYRRGAS